MRIILLHLIVQACFLTVCSAQIVIRHDLQNQKTTYLKIETRDTVPVKKPKVKSDYPVILQVENFNPFYYGAKVVPVTQEANNPGNAAVFNPFSVLAKSFGS